MSRDEVIEELRRRAALLLVPAAPPPPSGTVDALRFTWDGAAYLVPTTHVLETVRAVRLLSVPGATPPLLGAATVRSQAVPVIDLRAVLGLPTPVREVARLVVLGDAERPSLALAVDTLERVVPLRADELHAPAGTPAAVRAVTPDGQAVLDPDVLLGAPPFFRTSEGPHP